MANIRNPAQKIRYCPLVSESLGICQIPLWMAKKIDFEGGRISELKVSWPWPWPWHWIGSHSAPSCSSHRPLQIKFHSNRKKHKFFLWASVRPYGLDTNGKPAASLRNQLRSVLLSVLIHNVRSTKQSCRVFHKDKFHLSTLFKHYNRCYTLAVTITE